MADQPTATYVPGSWVAVSAPDCWLLVELPAEHEMVRRCWSLVSAAAAVDEILDALVARGIRTAPSFALVRLAADERRAVARGDASITITDTAGAIDVKVAAIKGAVWADEIFGEDNDVLLLASNQEHISSVELPMSAGVTMAASVRVSTRGAAEDQDLPATTVPEQQQAVASEPATEPPSLPPFTESPPPTEEAPAPQEPETPAAVEEPGEPVPSYDHLFGATQRPLPSRPTDPAPLPTREHDTSGWSTLVPQEIPAADATLAGYVEPAVNSAGLIDSVPGMGPAAHAPQPPPSPPRYTAPAGPPPAGSYVRPADVAQTVDRALVVEPATTVLPIAGPTVLAGRCVAGHLSPPHAAVCRLCGSPMPPGQQPVEIARPPLGVLRLSTGDVVTLDRGVLLGRAPEPDPAVEERPHVLRLKSPENDISRTHAEVVLDGWHVYVRDLNSTNGTVITLPGQPPLRLRPHDMNLLEHGTVVTLADEISFTFEVTG